MTPEAQASSANDAEAVFTKLFLTPEGRGHWMLAEITRRDPNLARVTGNAPA